MRTFKVLVLLTLLAAVPALAAKEPPRAAANSMATMHITPDTVSWEAEASGDLELTVARPDGAVARYEFAAGEAPALNLFDQRGQRLQDGVYTYELRNTRELGPGRSLLLSGSVEVREGSFVEPGVPAERSGGAKPIFEADQVISDDLIVDGNACIGDECALGDADGIAGLKLKAQDIQILFDDIPGGFSASRNWAIEINDLFIGGTERFSVSDRTSFTTPFTIRGGAPDHSLYVSSSGNVGLGTSVPAHKLHVFDGTTPPAIRRLFRLQNNGGVELALRDDSAFSGTGVEWLVRNVNAQLHISDVGDATHEMVLQQNGNVTFTGTVTPGSSRTIKQDFTTVDSRDVLRRVVELPISSWSYKADPGVRHVGPMSEDFFAVFAVGGDEKGISVTDSAGIALAAIQGLHQELAVLRDAEVAALRARIEELASLLEQLAPVPQSQ